ncbi:MAG: GIY-YIG nuclease family protein [Candidatus Magasanikbacteria bacterium]|nr:GIY-YIG nuclease family protein [Candidatus Magasanikbacteria bacterium]
MTSLYIGITNDLARRVSEHKQGLIEGFTKKYSCHRLVYYEHHTDVNEAIAREKQLKRWRREKKERLIKAVNPGWRDLSEEWLK